MLELKYEFRSNGVSKDITIRLGDVKQARASDHSAPWDIGVTILWGDEKAFDHPLSGIDPLHAVELAAKYASDYISGRATDEGGLLDPEIAS